MGLFRDITGDEETREEMKGDKAEETAWKGWTVRMFGTGRRQFWYLSSRSDNDGDIVQQVAAVQTANGRIAAAT